MANIREIIAQVDDVKPNAFKMETKLAWIGELDGRIAADVMLMGIEEIRQLEYIHPSGLDAVPLVSFPHQEIYAHYLCAQIDYANGEYSKYQNSMEMFNAHYDNFVHWFVTTYRPGQGYTEEGFYGE